MKKSLSMLLAGAMLVGTLAGCGGGSNAATTDNSGTEENTASGTVFKIGGTSPLTGDAAIYGNAVKNGAELAVQEINAEGGDIQFEVHFEDDQGQPDLAANAYAALKDWGMQLSLGAVTSKPGEAIAPLHQEDHIFALTPSASSEANVEGNDVVFQMCFTDPNQGLASADYIANQQLGTKIGIIYQSDEVYSVGIRDTFVEEAEAKGLDIVVEQTFTADNRNDFSVQLNACRDAGADLLFLPIYYTPASLILTQANQMGYAPKIFGVDGMDGILTVENFDTTLAEGVMLLTPFNADATDEATANFVTKYEEAYGETPNQFAADAYDCIYAYKLALETAGCTPDMSASELCDAMLETFPTITFEGLTGDGQGITWDDNGMVSKSPKGMVIENGAYVGM
ncbi:MAG TPA: ABC transporter substrate-binding protein [Candidatus Agathobaculum merdigallinarum]|nr:ABC transporter substrate-binding protein [Candidatus Agathobaculum merdigallinarum]